MGTHKTNINKSYSELYHGYNPICITFNIENKSLVAYTIYAVEGLPYVCIALIMSVSFMKKNARGKDTNKNPNRQAIRRKS